MKFSLICAPGHQAGKGYHFSAAEKLKLEKYGKIIPVDISTIEQIGGGSARCMMTEVF